MRGDVRFIFSSPQLVFSTKSIWDFPTRRAPAPRALLAIKDHCEPGGGD